MYRYIHIHIEYVCHFTVEIPWSMCTGTYVLNEHEQQFMSDSLYSLDATLCLLTLCSSCVLYVSCINYISSVTEYIYFQLC